jgi:hypothetical protein
MTRIGHLFKVKQMRIESFLTLPNINASPSIQTCHREKTKLAARVNSRFARIVQAFEKRLDREKVLFAFGVN